TKILRRAVLRPVAADEPARQHAIGRDADAELAAGLQNVALDAARDQRIFDLQVGDRMDRVGAAGGFPARLGAAELLYVTLLHPLAERADGLFDRHVGIEPRRTIDIDRFDAEPLQRISQEIPYRRRAAVIARPDPVGATQRAELDRDMHFVLA